MKVVAPYYFGPKNTQITPFTPYESYALLDTLDTSITLHRHDFIEILFFISGNGVHIINGCSYPIHPGSFSIIMPYHVHEHKSENEMPLVFYRCSFDASLLLRYLDTTEHFNELTQLIFSSSPAIQCPEKEQGTIENIFRSMIRNMEDSDYKLLFSGYEACQLVLQYLRLQHNYTSEQPPEAGVWQAIRYIYKNSCEDITLISISEQLNYNTKVLNSEIIAALGVSFKGLLKEIRIRNASSLLTAFPELLISNISKNVGFRSHTTFFRTFKEIWNMTPDEYRHKYLFRSIKTGTQNIPSALRGDLLQYISMNYTKDLKTKWLAEQFNVNEQKLNQEFTMYLGMSFPDYLSMHRITKARSLLGATNTPTNMIAEELGFNSLRTFTRAFQRYVGMTPNAYRAKLKKSVKNEPKQQL
jgi:AraC-like DNA-binding protein